MQILLLSGDLTPLRSKSQAKGILDALRKQKTSLTFPTSEGAEVTFTPVEGEPEFKIRHRYAASGVPQALQPEICVAEGMALEDLFRLRKSFNAYWNR